MFHIKYNNQYSLAYCNRGNVYKEQKKFDNAIDDYTMAIKHDNQYYIAYYNRSIVYNILGKHDKSKQDFVMFEKLKLEK